MDEWRDGSERTAGNTTNHLFLGLDCNNAPSPVRYLQLRRVDDLSCGAAAARGRRVGHGGVEEQRTAGAEGGGGAQQHARRRN